MKKIKIYISYHKEAPLIKNNIFEPIEVGRSLRNNKFLRDNMVGDNIGDNISDRNNRFCELTAQYFVWKNYDITDNSDYVGFMHYRRLFNFSEKKIPDNKIIMDKFSDDYFNDLGMKDEVIRNIIDDNDIITVKPFIVPDKNIYDHYKTSHHISDYKKALKILLTKYPDYKHAVKKYNKSKHGYFTNCYIMKREVFQEYMQWLFSILFELDNELPEYKNSNDNRVIGFIAERLFGIYLTYKRKEHLKIKELQQVFLTDNKNSKTLIPIVFSCNNNYTQHLCCALTSILENSNSNEEFVFYVINTKKNLNYFNKKLISKYNTSKSTVTYITIDNKVKILSNMPKSASCQHISLETYYRFLLSELFPKQDKILYLDCDIIVNSSLLPLFNTNVDKYYIMGVEDILAHDSCERLHLTKYINAGVLLINLKKWREDNIQTQLLDYALNNAHKIVWQDQDVLNAVLQNRIEFLDKTWNAQVGEYKHCYESEYNKIGKNAHILHFIGEKKPWIINSKNPFKCDYYKYLYKTPPVNYIFKHNLQIITYLLSRILRLIKKIRKFIIRYDKKDKKIVFLHFFSVQIKLSCC